LETRGTIQARKEEQMRIKIDLSLRNLIRSIKEEIIKEIINLSRDKLSI
jgi:hypothetical protein